MEAQSEVNVKWGQEKVSVLKGAKASGSHFSLTLQVDEDTGHKCIAVATRPLESRHLNIKRLCSDTVLRLDTAWRFASLKTALPPLPGP